MQREALIILAALLTVAVLAAGPGPEQTAAIDEPTPQKVVVPVDEEQAAQPFVTTGHQIGPVKFHLVGVSGKNSATLTVNLDVAI